MNLQLCLRGLPVSPALLYDIGNVWGGWSEARLDHLRSDAGIQLGLGPVRVVLPVWVSAPGDSGQHWRFRWLVGVQPLWASGSHPA